jgi:YVTN family beta-propeller protein
MTHRFLIIGTAIVCTALASLTAIAGNKAAAVGLPVFLSPHTAPIAVLANRVFVVNTPADTLDVLAADTMEMVARVPVGIDPVSIAVRPDGREVWVSNHISDSVSVIDTDPDSPTYLRVIATVQDFDPVTRATRFDEPMGIAFADNDKAYVALSSENQVAVVDTASRQVLKNLDITAQDPRAIAVHNGRLYVIPFESNNQTQISGCTGPLVGELCTFDATEHVVTNNNVLSLNVVVDVVKNPAVPDRDLYVFDTATDQLVQVVDTLGTLLYGITVDSMGRVYVTQADARNDANGKAGTKNHGLAEMDNRAFLNRITRVDCDGECGAPSFIDLEPLPPVNPAPGMALATPFAIQVSDDDATLVASAAGSNVLFTVDAASGDVLGRIQVEAVPRGIALESGEDGKPTRAWVLNAVANSVSLVDLADPGAPALTGTMALDDPTPATIKQGRMALNDAGASTSGTFSCESCHPDGNTDQLLWVLDTPFCGPGNKPILGTDDEASSLENGCNQTPPRITMPIRGLRDTAPYHWDGIPGDPYGGINTASILSPEEPRCDAADPASCTLDLVNGSLATTMCDTVLCPVNDQGQDGAMDKADRDALANLLINISYPPAQRRAYTNVVSERGAKGFSLFHIEGDLQGNPVPFVCGNCHRMPFWVSSNSPGTGMEAPTWRGAYDRWLILPQGRLNIIDFGFFENVMAAGAPERRVWRLSWAGRTRFDPVWDMVLEGSTGFPGAFARQVTLNPGTAGTTAASDLLDALEGAATAGEVLLLGEGLLTEDDISQTLDLLYINNAYLDQADPSQKFTRTELEGLAANGAFVGTFTAQAGENVSADQPQPALWTLSSLHIQSGQQVFPRVSSANTSLFLKGRHVRSGAHVLVNGKRVAGLVKCASGALPDCLNETVVVQLAHLPQATGMHLLQVQNPGGLVSNDFIFFSDTTGPAESSLDISGPWFNPAQDGHGWLVEQIAAAAPGLPDRLLAYWYVYNDGQPMWLIGLGDLVDGMAVLETFITSGGDFPPDFDPAAVSLETWGSMTFEFADNDTARVGWYPIAEGFESGNLDLQRLAPIDASDQACFSGTWYNPAQDGQGFVAEVLDANGETKVFLSWYTYRDGQQVWLLGLAPLVDGEAEITMNAYFGADFPPDFDSDDVNSPPWGVVSLHFTGPDTARVDWLAHAEGSQASGMNLARLTQLKGHTCQ